MSQKAKIPRLDWREVVCCEHVKETPHVLYTVRTPLFYATICQYDSCPLCGGSGDIVGCQDWSASVFHLNAGKSDRYDFKSFDDRSKSRSMRRMEKYIYDAVIASLAAFH